MQLDEFERHIKTDEHCIVKVRQHKTFYTHGHAHVTLPHSLFTYLKLYVKHIRPRYASGDDCSYVFINFTGRKMQSGEVSRRMNSIWERSGVYGERKPPKRKLCGNIIRKSITTMVHRDAPNQTQPVADLLAHRLSTAEKTYRIKRMETQATHATNVINKVTRSSR